MEHGEKILKTGPIQMRFGDNDPGMQIVIQILRLP
jgi:hypothetical protein